VILMEEWEALEWEQLRVEGKPLLSGAAFGATPLFWVACRAQPCLVHIFCDTQLQVKSRDTSSNGDLPSRLFQISTSLAM